MSRLFQTGFELQSTTNGVEVDSFTGSTVSIDTSTFRSGLASLKLAASSNVAYFSALFTSTNTNNVYARAYVNFSSLPASGNIALMGLHSTAAGNNISLRVQHAGTLILTNEQNASSQIGSTSSALSTNTWYRIELSYNYLTGAANAYINGSNFATGTANTNIATDTLRIGIVDSSTFTVNVDDVAINDQTGLSQTGLPGVGSIIHVQPDAMGDANSFPIQIGGTLGSSNNYTRVDEITPDDASTYNASLVLNQEDLFNVGSSGVGPGDTVNVVAVGLRFANITLDPSTAIKAEIEKTSGGTILQSASLVPDSTTWVTNNSTTTTSPYPIITYQDPDGANWTSTTLGTMQIGYKLTTANINSVAVSTLWASIDYTPAPGFDVSVHDSTATSELITKSITSFITVSDTTVTSEFVDSMRASSRDITVSDTTITSEVIHPEVNSFINKSDTTTTSEAIHLEIDSFVGVSDTTTTSESVTILNTGYNINISDTTITSENVSLYITAFFIFASDTTVTSEAITLIKLAINQMFVTDSTLTSESVSVVEAILVIQASDTTVTSEAINTTDTSINVSDTTITSEAISPLTGSLVVRTSTFSMSMTAPIVFNIVKT